ncbi:hypothetical protein B0E41_13940 [Hydrogenophaga sp. A37]|uniref:hypothetical protein n=1 Tax=Hydrogenophaga sp. A37 TaxID=1945864 RepID=UPI000986701E|nr:hypothetical protein [Hydrogenophaga sp. A37]OOG82881.1 hypothetical protein B0E41_13940 [Hydrogenophaga sp. A37]
MTTHDNRWVRAGLAGTLSLLLTACGGVGSADTSANGAQARSTPAEASSAVNAQPDAQLTAQTLARAETQAQKADASQPLERLLPGRIAAKAAYVSGAIARKADAVRIPAYRFYNARTGAHFFTTSTAERDHIVNTLSPPFNLEGAAFSVASDFSPGLSPVHRFYNTRTGVHFYTISESERANVVATLPHFNYEGVAYHASQVSGAGLLPFYRFYVPSGGFHFYTASEAEKDNIIANLSATYRYEGIGYYVLGDDSLVPEPAAHALYFSPAGVNTNPGTAALPKRDRVGVDINTLPAGTLLLFERGGSYSWPFVILENLNATETQPILIGDYGTGTKPVFNTTGDAIFFGNYQNTSFDGGYTFRNVRFIGPGSGTGMFLQSVHHVTLDGVEMSNYGIAIQSQADRSPGVHNLRIVNSSISRNTAMGILGQFSNSVIENNVFEANNFRGSGLDHGTYLSGKTGYSGYNIVIRNNHYNRNSNVNGVCTGGNMTFHGQMDGVLIEGNRIEQDAAADGCWEMSITQGYGTAEWFRNFVVRNNKLINAGNTGMAVQSAPGIVIEGNIVINTQNRYQTSIGVGHNEYQNGDVPDGNATVRNNTVCQSGGATGPAVNVTAPNSVVTDNVTVTGSAATTGVCAR